MKKYIVRFSAMRSLGVVEIPANVCQGFVHGVDAIVQTQRGLERATLLTEISDEKIAELPQLSKKTQLRFVRRATKEDYARLASIKANEQSDFDRCLKIVERMKVRLTLSRVERLFGGERLVVYYVADGRVDFRELVKALAAEFQTRIEMKQIGVRDEMKLLADLGDCGRDVCCKIFLTVMPPISMRMAKLQKATLDPTKVSGRCGRLKCCLRYEFDLYNERSEQAPELESEVMTPDGLGKTISQDLYSQRVVVALNETGERKTFSFEELEYCRYENKNDASKERRVKNTEKNARR